MNQIHRAPAERDPHPLRIDDVGRTDVGLQLRRRHQAVLVAIDRREEARPHAADARRRFRRDVDFVRIDGAVAIAIDHVAGHVRVAAVHVPQHVLVGDEPGRVGEDGAARCVIEVAVAVDDVAHRHLEAAAELVLQPGGERRIDRIAEDDAVARDEKDRVPVAVARPIEIAGERNDLASRPAWLRLHDERRCEQGRDQTRRASVSLTTSRDHTLPESPWPDALPPPPAPSPPGCAPRRHPSSPTTTR